MDLKLSANILHVRTCSDSCRALCEIITYFAKDQDLEQDVDKLKQHEERKVDNARNKIQCLIGYGNKKICLFSDGKFKNNINFSTKRNH